MRTETPTRLADSAEIDRSRSADARAAAQERDALQNALAHDRLRSTAMNPVSDKTNAATALIIVAAVLLAVIFATLYFAMR